LLMKLLLFFIIIINKILTSDHWITTKKKYFKVALYINKNISPFANCSRSLIVSLSANQSKSGSHGIFLRSNSFFVCS